MTRQWLRKTWTKIFVSLLVIPIYLLTGCSLSLSLQPLPTYAPTAFVEIVPQQIAFEVELPATFTPIPAVTATPEPTVTPAPSPTLRPTPEPSPTPTVNVIPAFIPQPPYVPYLEEPPATTDCDGRGFLFGSRFASAVAGPWRDYHAYLPPCYGEDGRVYPVLYLIHGSVQTDSHWVDLGLARHADAGINNGRYPPFIVIMPYSGELGNVSSGGEKSIEGVTVNYLIPFVDANFCSWHAPEGRSIGGISRGGYWALEIAFRNTHLFTAVAGHSSHLRFETDPPRYNPLATYAEADLSRMRIWLDWGERDFLRPGQQRLHAALSEADIAHEVHVNPGGHSDAYWAVHLSRYLDWHALSWPLARETYPLCQRR